MPIMSSITLLRTSVEKMMMIPKIDAAPAKAPATTAR